MADTRGSHWSIGLALAAYGYVFLVLGWNRPKRGNRTEQAPHLSPQKACFCEQCAKGATHPRVRAGGCATGVAALAD